MKRIFLLTAFVLACAAATDQALAQPTLTFAQPLAARIGETTEITLHGDKLEDPLSVWTSFAGSVEIVRELDEAGQPKPNANPKAIRLRVSVPQETAASIGGIVVGTKAGVSDPIRIMLDDLPTLAETGNNHALATPQDIPALTAVDAVSEGAQFDYFRFTATAGQRVGVEVVGARLGFAFDPVMRLLDASGKELAFADDDSALGADCRLAHTFAQDGQYVIEVRDVQYRGGGRYRVRVGDFPLVTAPFPLGAPRGASTEFRFTGLDGETAAPATAVAPSDAQGPVALAAKLPGGQSSCMATATVSELPNVLDIEPNNTLDAAQDVSLPAAINGQFQTPGEPDCYRFSAKKDEKYVMRGLSRTLGSPAYLFLRVFDEKGAKLAEAGAGNDVETLAFTVPADGVYRLSVEELLQTAGPGYAYRVEIEPDRPRFTLAIKNDKNLPHKFLASASGAFVLDVQAERQGYDGPIHLSLQAPCEGFQVRQDIIAAGAKETRLLVFAPPDLQEGELLALRVKGQAAEGDAVAELTTAALLKTKQPTLTSVPSWMDGVIHVAVGAPPDVFFALTLKEETVALDREKSEAKFVLPIERKNKDYKQDPIVIVEGLPAGVTASIKKEGKDQEERFEITLAGKNLPAGENPFQVLAFGDFQGRGIKTEMTAKLKVE